MRVCVCPKKCVSPSSAASASNKRCKPRLQIGSGGKKINLFSIIHLLLLWIPRRWETLPAIVAKGRTVRCCKKFVGIWRNRRHRKGSGAPSRGKSRELLEWQKREISLRAEVIWRLRGEMMVLISLLLLTGCCPAGESEFYIWDVAKRERGKAKVTKPTAIRKDLMWSHCTHESIFFFF